VHSEKGKRKRKEERRKKEKERSKKKREGKREEGKGKEEKEIGEDCPIRFSFGTQGIKRVAFGFLFSSLHLFFLASQFLSSMALRVQLDFIL